MQVFSVHKTGTSWVKLSSVKYGSLVTLQDKDGGEEATVIVCNVRTPMGQEQLCVLYPNTGLVKPVVNHYQPCFVHEGAAIVKDYVSGT